MPSALWRRRNAYWSGATDQLRKQEALDNLRQKITDDFGLVMFDYAEDVSGPVPLPFEGMVEELPVVTEVSPTSSRSWHSTEHACAAWGRSTRRRSRSSIQSPSAMPL